MPPEQPPPPPPLPSPWKRRGPKPKPPLERAPRRTKPLERVERSYPRDRKLQVINFLLNHRVYLPLDAPVLHWQAPRSRGGQPADNGAREERRADGKLVRSRPPTYEETAEFFKVPVSTVCGWFHRRERILNPVKRKKAVRKPRPPVPAPGTQHPEAQDAERGAGSVDSSAYVDATLVSILEGSSPVADEQVMSEDGEAMSDDEAEESSDYASVRRDESRVGDIASFEDERATRGPSQDTLGFFEATSPASLRAQSASTLRASDPSAQDIGAAPSRGDGGRATRANRPGERVAGGRDAPSRSTMPAGTQPQATPAKIAQPNPQAQQSPVPQHAGRNPTRIAPAPGPPAPGPVFAPPDPLEEAFRVALRAMGQPQAPVGRPLMPDLRAQYAEEHHHHHAQVPHQHVPPSGTPPCQGPFSQEAPDQVPPHEQTVTVRVSELCEGCRHRILSR
ncbi:hypothetical protein NKR23_g6492 [Pleurostoma richardsiae]|uniref:Uncharacterized protein n=1 Tax=Pleurostoma richardsiae TaxID=41990 RepID=A0AA38VNX9_9PEZI|nr:hypothetical protein NKR23_g6492 [Pleurostoma richardsiae]